MNLQRFKRAPSKVLADAAWLSGGTVTTFLVSIAGMILIPRFLETAAFGVWKTYQVVLQYTGLSHFGLINALMRVGPGLAQAPDKTRFHRAMGSVLWAMVFVGLVELAVIGVLTVMRWDEPLLRYSLLLLGALVFLQQLHMFYDCAATVTRQFKLKSVALAGFTTARTALMILAAWAFGLEAMLVAYAITMFATTILLARRARVRIPRGLGLGALPGLFKTGIPITAVVMVEVLVQTTDKIVTVAVLGFEMMGYYGLATMVFPLLLMLPQSFRQVVSMEVYRNADDPQTRPSANRLVRRTTLLLALAAPLMAGALFLGVEWGIRLILPRYLPGLDAMRILCFAVVPLAWTQACFSTLIVFRKEFFVVAAGLLAAGGNVVLSMLLLGRGGLVLEAIALVHAAGFLIFGLAVVLKAESVMRGTEPGTPGGPGLVGGAVRCLAPLVYTVALVLAVEWLLPVYRAEDPSHLVELGRVAARLAVFGVLALPVLVPLYRLAKTSSLGNRA